MRLLRRVLLVEPGNLELHAQLAVLLAQTGRGFDSWQGFRTAAQGLERDHQVDAAASVLSQATRYLPRRMEPWQDLARLERSRGNGGRAVQLLLGGRRHLRGRRRRPEAIALLREANEIDPLDSAVVLELARLLHREDQAEEAHELLEGLAARVTGRTRWEVRRRQCRLEPTLVNVWRCLVEGLGLMRARTDKVGVESPPA